MCTPSELPDNPPYFNDGPTHASSYCIYERTYNCHVLCVHTTHPRRRHNEQTQVH
jgi:hypothetical protein